MFYLSLELSIGLHTLSASSTHAYSRLGAFERIPSGMSGCFDPKTTFPSPFPSIRTPWVRNSDHRFWPLCSTVKNNKLVCQTKQNVLIFFVIKL